MNESPRFDLGLSELQDVDGDLSEEFPTALKHFQQTETTHLYEGGGYIWRKYQTDDALDIIPIKMRSKVFVPPAEPNSLERTLQNITKYIYEQKRLLRSQGIVFDAEYLVHEVNGDVQLIAAVPKVEKLYPESGDLKSDKDWEEYISKFIQLQKNLLAYYDDRISVQKPLLWDDTKLEQYVYGPVGVDGERQFVLVDPDCRCEWDRNGLNRFISRAEDAIRTVRSQLEVYGPGSADRRGEEFESLLTQYQKRYDELRSMNNLP